MHASLDKLEQCVQLANRLDARMVILGDLFDRPRESDIALLSNLIGVLKQARHPILCLVGNHDKSGQHLTEDTTLALLGRAGVLEVVDRIQSIELAGLTLHCVPHGHPIPVEVRPSDGVSVMVTHHDLAIAPNLNPHAVDPHPVLGCDLVVNGHDHTTKPPLQVGDTLYFNPGNISRVSIAQLHHTPAVFALIPEDPAAQGEAAVEEHSLFDAKPVDAVAVVKGWALRRFELVCASGESVFDLTGYNAASSTDAALADFMASFTRTSQERFIQALAATSELQAAGGGDAVERIVREVMDDMNVSAVVRQIVEEHILASAD